MSSEHGRNYVIRYTESAAKKTNGRKKKHEERKKKAKKNCVYGSPGIEPIQY